MRLFTKLVQEIESTTKDHRKFDALVRYFSVADDASSVWAIAILSGNRPRRIVTSNSLRTWAQERTDLPQWLFDDSYQIVGDPSEAISLLVPKPNKPKDHSLYHWIRLLLELQESSEAQKKIIIAKAWNQLNRHERIIFNKLLTGGLRIGVSQKLMVSSISKYTGIDESTLAYKLTGKWDPNKITFDTLFRIEPSNTAGSKPYPFYETKPLNKPVSELGITSEWIIERKWEGIRCQLIIRNDEVFIWSKEELVTDRFPELHPLVDVIPEGTVMDGELICHDGHQLLSYSLLKSRLSTKNISKKLRQNAPASFLAFDLLEFNRKDIRDLSLQNRRVHLEEICNNAKFENLLISEIQNPSSWLQATKLRDESRSYNSEGLMLRRKISSYQSGQKNEDWWNWKVDPLTINAVLIYATIGPGSNLLSDYTFAVLNGESLVPVTKTRIGLQDENLQEIDEYVKNNTVERFGPVRSVRPELVFEISFDGIEESKRNKSGIVLKFPRVTEWIKEKSIHEVNSLEELKALVTIY